MTALAAARLVIIVRFTPPGLSFLPFLFPQAVADLAVCDCKGPLHPSAACALPSRIAIEFLAGTWEFFTTKPVQLRLATIIIVRRPG
ncbi:hypothetical protein [Mesorhizobium sp. M0208]|uniref:hypothetical protein n=1 Tax=Mesorhizobium sp. M0208 TaxID=2956916 RepID=UPI00333A14D5